MEVSALKEGGLDNNELRMHLLLTGVGELRLTGPAPWWHCLTCISHGWNKLTGVALSLKCFSHFYQEVLPKYYFHEKFFNWGFPLLATLNQHHWEMSQYRD